MGTGIYHSKDNKNIGDRIRRYRREKGMDQKELAAILAVSPSVISNLESGKSMVGVDTLLAIVRALDIGIEDLLPEYSHVSKSLEDMTEVAELLNDYEPEERIAIISFINTILKAAEQKVKEA